MCLLMIKEAAKCGLLRTVPEMEQLLFPSEQSIKFEIAEIFVLTKFHCKFT